MARCWLHVCVELIHIRARMFRTLPKQCSVVSAYHVARPGWPSRLSGFSISTSLIFKRICPSENESCLYSLYNTLIIYMIQGYKHFNSTRTTMYTYTTLGSKRALTIENCRHVVNVDVFCLREMCKISHQISIAFKSKNVHKDAHLCTTNDALVLGHHISIHFRHIYINS